MHTLSSKYIIILLAYGILINVISFSEVYWQLSLNLSLYFGYVLMALLTVAFVLDWTKFTRLITLIKILALLFILLETYMSGVVLIILSIYQDVMNSIRTEVGGEGSFKK
ncbi:hypothetical protein A3850_003425 [Lewinella sp. 4G2]|nr:hypothetical protein A3850_003425 [Lewinella sp. 4G2]